MAFSWVVTRTEPGGLVFCVFYEAQPKESSFIEKPELEPATPGLQDIGSSPTPRRLRCMN